MMDWLKTVSVGEWAGWLAVLVAFWYFGVADWAAWLAVLVALVYGAKEIQSSREDTREATAIQTWMEYYSRCLEYPEYACPELLKLDYNKLDKLEGNELREFSKYQWFVSFMLLACDQVIRLPKGGPNWEQFIRNNVGYHRNYLKRLYFSESYRPPFSPELISKVKEVLDESGEKQTSEGA